ncbi:hypothetical protein [Reinekea sp. G2M2-21]|uniref:hypothetical protein n=1 Tax=Reinekea sp. G2M2-21 TaxID=2788942 RepID=UPI0018A9B3A1|nr:hypothetical protein [Reinekea sp. G2M2-21]
MIDPSISVSAFSSPEHLWSLLNEGYTLTFKEYEHSGIPPDYIQLGKLDIVTRWKDYSRSLRGLLAALVDNAERLVQWRYMRWSGAASPQDPILADSYYTLVDTYRQQIINTMSRYYGVKRVIEAGAWYSYFLCDEASLLACFKYDQLFKWQSHFQWKAKYSGTPEAETCPVDYSQNPDILESKDGYRIKRVASSFSGSGLRYTIVCLCDMGVITSDQLIEWLNSGYHVEYSSVTLFGPDDDGLVFGTDAYGQDFFAGEITRPTDITASLQYHGDRDTG